MIDRKRADELATRYVAGLRIDPPGLIDWPATREMQWGWIYFYGAPPEASPLAGNAPFIIERSSGQILITGTRESIGHYIRNYEVSGDPQVGYGLDIVLVDWRSGAETIPAIKTIRDLTSLSLAEAKAAVNACLEGKAYIVRIGSLESAELLTGALNNLGFSTKRLPGQTRKVASTQTPSPLPQ